MEALIRCAVMRCTRCVMDDSSDPTISFDAAGHCSYCNDALVRMPSIYFPNKQGEEKLKNLIDKIKKDGEGKKYDCIMGLSGGLDSSYLAYLGHKWNLRVLAVHIDDGYDTEISKNNLKKLIQKTGFDYETIVPDPGQFNALTLAFMKAGVPNIAIPQDNVLFAFLYKQMKKHKIRWFLSGDNFSLESILQHGNTYKNTDVVNIKDIFKKFGNGRINKLKFISTTQKVMDKKLQGIHTVSPLNYVKYDRDLAFRELNDFCGFQYYGRKHLENILTAFIQLYWFPKKFGVDKRTSHLSSMIVSGQLTRDEAMKQLEEPLYDAEKMDGYIRIIKKQLGLSDEDFAALMNAPTHQHFEYKTEDKTLAYRFLKFVKHIFRISE